MEVVKIDMWMIDGTLKICRCTHYRQFLKVLHRMSVIRIWKNCIILSEKSNQVANCFPSHCQLLKWIARFN